MDISVAGASDAAVYLHIGTHKTGTTSFQRWASANQAELAVGTRLKYYEGLLGWNHCELAILAMRANRNMPMRVRLPDWCLREWQRTAEAHIREQVARRDGPLLISAESMSLLRHRDEIERLAGLLRPRELFVVVALRDRATFLHGYRQTLERHGFEESEYRDSFAYVAEDSWLVDYDALLAVYREVIGADRVAVLSYEDAMRSHGSIIPAIMEPLGFAPTQIPAWQNVAHNVTRAERPRPTRRHRLRLLLDRATSRSRR